MIRHPSDMAVDWCVCVCSRLQLPAVQEPRLDPFPWATVVTAAVLFIEL